MADGPNVDLVTDAHTMKGVTKQFDFAFSVSVFEHLMMPWVAAHALNRVLNSGALVFIQSHPSWPLHEEPWDFFRFSKDAWSSIFSPFTGFEIIDAGYALEASIVPANASGGALQTFEDHRTYLVSSCLARKIGVPTHDWSADPAEIHNLKYSHGTL
ncbi:class I SAM-dependent methyltransferase [Mesorhizobium australicum]|uniref:methyltransferase domain-containing protein n=1 Tax=Mesorhizobium australicum TaxID=536018 RepID=UPI0033387BCF